MQRHNIFETAVPGALPGSPLAVAVDLRDREIAQTVHRAIEQGDVMLAYQPIVRASDPEVVAFYEGLIRIADHTGRILPASDFIHAIENEELGRKLDTLALSLGLQALIDEPGLRLSINLSARSIGYGPWLHTLAKGLDRHETIGERLILEITERSAIATPELVSVFMKDMQGHGIAFALDDFGAGYSAFRYLKDFYFDILKISGTFTTGIAESPDNQILTQAILSVAQHFDMFTVAQGVESWEDAEFLSGTGVDCLQGNFFGAATVRPWWQSTPLRDAG